MSIASDLHLDYQHAIEIEESRNVSQDVNNAQMIFYNRVPKCGSTTTKFLFKKLEERNKFNFPNESVWYPPQYHFNTTEEVSTGKDTINHAYQEIL